MIDVRRTFRVLVGFFFAILAAAATQVRFALPHSPALSSGVDKLSGWWSDFAMLVLATSTHIFIFSFLFALVAIVIGEWQRRREWTYYVLTGLVIAIGGFVAQYAAENAKQPTILNNYALIAFVTSGAIGGLVYWVFAGHRAGRARTSPRIAVADESESDEEALVVDEGADGQRPAEASNSPDAPETGGIDPDLTEPGGPEPADGAETIAQKPITSVPDAGPSRDARRIRISPHSVTDTNTSEPEKA
ncbi:MAG: hypothetical protein KDJ47_06255 [Hyphomicrobiaceae bacterium]|nr:hypothetical protein [Hyphomicrobiaceae bacterium]